MERLVILSLIDYSQNKHGHICSLFGCTKLMFDKAILLSKDGLKILGKVSITSNKLNLSKCENFLEFIFSNGST